jgi:hypothetical protein
MLVNIRTAAEMDEYNPVLTDCVTLTELDDDNIKVTVSCTDSAALESIARLVYNYHDNCRHKCGCEVKDWVLRRTQYDDDCEVLEAWKDDTPVEPTNLEPLMVHLLENKFHHMEFTLGNLFVSSRSVRQYLNANL